MTTLDVQKTLEDEKSKYPRIEVEREDNLQYDLGNLAAFDPKPLDIKALKSDPQKYLIEVARDNVQLLFNRIFDLPTETAIGANGVLVKLPPHTTIIPREKPIPQQKPPTKWETFAKSKGIGKYNPKDKGRMVIDEQDGQMKAKWGYKRAGDLKDEWVLEDKPGEDPSVDPFTRKEMEKKEKISKQEKKTIANQKRAAKEQGVKLPSTIALQVDTGSRKQKQDYDEALALARKSTVSMGRYDPLLPNEKKPQEKRKFDPLVSELEKTKNMKVLNKILGASEGKLDMQRVTNLEIADQQKKKRKVNLEASKKRNAKKKKS